MTSSGIARSCSPIASEVPTSSTWTKFPKARVTSRYPSTRPSIILPPSAVQKGYGDEFSKTHAHAYYKASASGRSNTNARDAAALDAQPADATLPCTRATSRAFLVVWSLVSTTGFPRRERTAQQSPHLQARCKRRSLPLKLGTRWRIAAWHAAEPQRTMAREVTKMTAAADRGLQLERP